MVSTTTVLWYALMIVVGQGAFIAALLTIGYRVARGFGAYADALSDARAENVRLHSLYAIVKVDNLSLTDRLAECERRKQPLQSEEVVA